LLILSTTAAILTYAYRPSEVIPTKIETQSIDSVDEFAKEPLFNGIAIGSKLPYLDSNALNGELKEISDAGFKSIRLDLEWSIVQPQSEEQYDWANFDKIMEAIRAHNLKANLILDRTPRWARADSCVESPLCPPADPEKFAYFATQVYERYGKQVEAWEVWNEPNTYSFWKPQPNVKDYVDLLKYTYVALKKIDPKTVVLLGGLSGSTGDGNAMHVDPRTFLDGVYNNGGKNYFDAIAYHPYTNLQSIKVNAENNGWAKIMRLPNNIVSIMAKNDDVEKPIWLNEIGIPTNGPKQIRNSFDVPYNSSFDHVSLELQATFVQQIIDEAKGTPQVHSVYWYTFKDNSTVADDNDNFYGLMTKDGIKKPAFHIIQNEINK
jgi:hypothetical protein